MEFRNDGFCYDTNGNEIGYHGIHKKKRNKGGNSWFLYLIFLIIVYESHKNYLSPTLNTFKAQLNHYSKLFTLRIPGIYWVVVVIIITYFLFKTIIKKKDYQRVK